MKTLILSAVILALAVNISFSQTAEEMQKWQEYMTPGEMHKILSKGVGNWKASTTFWMTPGGEATKSEATATSEMILGGRYLMSKMSGNMWGMPFEGIAIEAYDNAAKMFMSTWIDNMGTGIMYMTGKYDASSKQINYAGKMVDPMTGNWVDIREVVTYTNDNTTKMEMYCPGPDGKEFKTMELISTKQ